MWTIISFVLLLAGVGGMVWYFASQPRTVADELLPENDPLLGLRPTPSQRATIKYFFVLIRVHSECARASNRRCDTGHLGVRTDP